MPFPRNGYSDLTSTSSISRASSLGRYSWTETPYSASARSKLGSIYDHLSLSPDPQQWGFDLSPDLVEPDDALHSPDVRGGKVVEIDGKPFSPRGFANLGCLAVLCAGILALFVGYPIITYIKTSGLSMLNGYNLGGINSTGQVPSMGNFGLIDLDTPHNVYTKRSVRDGSTLQLVFSDEFNTDGRTFYPGDDPYWEAVDLHYWATNNLEWYDPEAITTVNGSLVITFSETPTHNLNFRGGLMSSWNKFCFTGGMIETSVQLPGANNVVGLWPAIWTMGNLGRAGYGASLEGMWPYTYDACDVGTAPNQTHNGLPLAATVNGDPSANGALSYLPGQRLSRCTCDGENHPGPKHSDGTYVGRSAPEIDVFEAQITGQPLTSQVSQSAQWAPFNNAYVWLNTSDNLLIADTSVSKLNKYIGGATQQATSIVTDTTGRCYELEEGCYSVYAFEYKPGYDDAYISWISENKLAWTLNVAGMAADTSVETSARPVPQEPMYIIINLGMSTNFGDVDLKHLSFPNHMRVDYIRVYQRSDSINVGCNPKKFPTTDYIQRHAEVYTNPNLTTWRGDYGQPFPKNSFIESC